MRSRGALKPTPSLRLDPCPGLAVPADKLPRLAEPHLKSAKLTTQPSPGGCETQKPRSPPASLRRRPGRHLPQGAAAPGAGRGGARGSGHPPRPAESPDGAGKSPAGPTADDAAAANLSTRAILGSDPPDPTCVARGRSWAEGRSNVAGRGEGAGQGAEGGARGAGGGASVAALRRGRGRVLSSLQCKY